jgi:hypothetical protein
MIGMGRAVVVSQNIFFHTTFIRNFLSFSEKNFYFSRFSFVLMMEGKISGGFP